MILSTAVSDEGRGVRQVTHLQLQMGGDAREALLQREQVTQCVTLGDNPCVAVGTDVKDLHAVCCKTKIHKDQNVSLCIISGKKNSFDD